MLGWSRNRVLIGLGLAAVLGAAVGSGTTALVMSKRQVAARAVATPTPAAGTPTPSPERSAIATPSPTLRPVTGPGNRFDAAGAFDQARGKLIVFGGRDATNTFINETWTWDGSVWKLEHPSISPSPRGRAAMAYDIAHAQVVLHGGTDGRTQWFNDTWIWDGSNWTQAAPKAIPPYQAGYQLMTYDSDRQAALLFDWTGPATGTELNEVWSWNGTDWAKLATTGATPTGHTWQPAAMAYLAAIKSTVFYGRGNGGFTWVLNGANTWFDLGVTGSPGPGWVMAADDKLGIIVLVSGLGDFWTFSGTSWSNAGSLRVSQPFGSLLVYDSVRHVVIDFAGSAASSFSWDGYGWSALR